MPMMLYPKCWRGRDDGEPIHCIDAAPADITEEQMYTLDYEPLSFVCSGCSQNPEIPQDQYRLCFKNSTTDEMTDNDLHDLGRIVTVGGAALSLGAIRKGNQGVVEVHAETGRECVETPTDGSEPGEERGVWGR